MRYHLQASLVLAILVLASGPAYGQRGRDAPEAAQDSAMRWIGDAICYGPHRDGQFPGGPSPSAAEIREDLRLMLPHWRVLRLYGSSEVAETVLSVIRADSLDMKVMLGAWIAAEPEAATEPTAAANRREVDAAIRLANAYPEIVVAVCVGNETQVDWSDHRSPPEVLVRYLRRVRAAVAVPVTSADDFKYWLLPESRALDREVDFITVHVHPLWNGRQLDEALPWLKEQLAAVRAVHASRPLVLGETGWATAVDTVGQQATLIKGRVGETEQKLFHESVLAWARAERLPVFFFEAFDEHWKGGPRPAEVEKNWGLFRADRSPKRALAGR